VNRSGPGGCRDGDAAFLYKDQRDGSRHEISHLRTGGGPVHIPTKSVSHASVPVAAWQPKPMHTRVW